MNQRLKRCLVAATCLIILMALPGVLIARQHRQVKLDRALIVAIRRSDDPAFDALLAKGANSNSTNDGFGTALGYAVVAGNKYEVKALIAAGADINARDHSGWTALKYANEHKYTEIASILRAAGENE